MKNAIIAVLMLVALNVGAQQQLHRRSIWYSPYSGITGQVFLVRADPVGGTGGTIIRTPYQARLAVYSQAGRLIKQITTDDQGKFRIGLRPGTYVVVPLVEETDNDAPPPAVPIDGPVSVTVSFKQYTEVTIFYGTAIR